MTKQDFEALAGVVRATREKIEAECGPDSENYHADDYFPAMGATVEVANRMADVFTEANPRFKRDLFMQACRIPL